MGSIFLTLGCHTRADSRSARGNNDNLANVYVVPGNVVGFADAPGTGVVAVGDGGKRIPGDDGVVDLALITLPGDQRARWG